MSGIDPRPFYTFLEISPSLSHSLVVKLSTMIRGEQLSSRSDESVKEKKLGVHDPPTALFAHPLSILSKCIQTYRLGFGRVPFVPSRQLLLGDRRQRPSMSRRSWTEAEAGGRAKLNGRLKQDKTVRGGSTKTSAILRRTY